MDELEITEVFEAVAEMSNSPAGLVTVPQDVLASVTEGDDDPRFATFVIESGWSKSRRYWGSELFSEIASEIQQAPDPIVGYMGHIKPEDDPYSFPEIQLQWVGAKLVRAGENAKLAVKAYVLPGTKGRDYLKRGLVKTVSWRGKAALEPFEKGVRVRKFNIESIDLSRPRAAGMSARLVGALTSEQETHEGGNSVKPEEIAALQENELRAHNSGLVEAIETNARKPLDTKIAEMENEAKKTEPVIGLIPQLRALLGLKDDADEVTVVQSAISSLKAEGKKLREGILDKVLEKRLKGGSDSDKALVRRVLVGEMESRDVKLTGNSDDDEKAVTEMVTQIIDGDDSLKKTVSEMEAAPPAIPGTQDAGKGSPTEWKPGVTTKNVRVKQRV